MNRDRHPNGLRSGLEMGIDAVRRRLLTSIVLYLKEASALRRHSYQFQ
jgi:hypothetical protein